MKKQINPNVKAHLIRGVFYLLLLLAVSLIPFALAQRTTAKGNRPATTITVTNENDSGPGSLRQALADAQDGDTINFDPSVNVVTLTSTELAIAKSITISASPRTVTVRSQTTQFRIFHVMPGYTVQITSLYITAGHGMNNGGGVFNDQSTLTIASCTISGNQISGEGGGIHNTGTLTLLDSTVSSNQAFFGGGFSMGGGISNTGSMTIINGSVASNFCNIAGGGIWNEGMMTITDTAISGNEANGGHQPGHGGGIANIGKLTIQNSVISNNSAEPNLYDGSGGGIDNRGALEIFRSSIIGNRATFTGGGIAGGGTITDSLITNNLTLLPGPATGGGLSGDGFIISNCTIDGNQSAGNGGGIAGGGNIAHSTFSNNSASSNGGAIYLTSTLELGNTILKAGTSGVNIFNNGGTFITHGYNISSDDGSGLLNGPGDQINTDPMLGPLQDNGGPTFTHALLPGSPAIDAGDPNFTPPPFFDQRGPGFDRIVNGRIDKGSFEVQGPSATPTPTSTPTPTATATPTATPTLTPRPSPTPRVAPTPRVRPTPPPRP